MQAHSRKRQALPAVAPLEAAAVRGVAYAAMAAQESAWQATEILAAAARQKAAEAAAAVAELEAQSAQEKERVDAAIAEYETLKQKIKNGTAGFRALHGHDPKSLRECPSGSTCEMLTSRPVNRSTAARSIGVCVSTACANAVAVRPMSQHLTADTLMRPLQAPARGMVIWRPKSTPPPPH